MAFEKDMKYGEIGEHIAWLELLQSPKVKQVLDVRHDRYFQDRDIDFLALKTNGQVDRWEVKTDRQAHQTGNLVFETKSNSNEGCLARSEAQWIWYAIPETNETIIVDFAKLKGYVLHKKPNEVSMGDNARGYLLNIQELIDYQVATRR